jgi:hypothetical protein
MVRQGFVADLEADDDLAVQVDDRQRVGQVEVDRQVGRGALGDGDGRTQAGHDLALAARVDDRDLARGDLGPRVVDELHRGRIGVDDDLEQVIGADGDRGFLQNCGHSAQVDEVDRAGGRIGRIGGPDVLPGISVTGRYGRHRILCLIRRGSAANLCGRKDRPRRLTHLKLAE